MSGWIRGAWKVGKEAFKKQKTTGTEVIKKIEPAKNLTERRETFEKLTGVNIPKKAKQKIAIKGSKVWDAYGKAVKERKKANKKLLKQTVGGGAATIAGAVGAMEFGKRKFPKFKKFVESSVKIEDGKLGLKSKKD